MNGIVLWGKSSTNQDSCQSCLLITYNELQQYYYTLFEEEHNIIVNLVSQNYLSFVDLEYRVM